MTTAPLKPARALVECATSNTYGYVLAQRQRAVAVGMDAVLGG
jgi:hypothetical protein